MIFIGGVNGLIYPLGFGGGVKGRWHPYLTGGFGYALYDLDSNYTDSSASGLNLDAGAGIKLIADNLIFVRAELLYQVHDIQFEPGKYFDQRDANTVRVPVLEFDNLGRLPGGRELLQAVARRPDLPGQVGFGVVF